LTHSGAAEALRLGVASAVANVALGATAVAVAPSFIAVGSTDIAVIVGEVYSPTVDESPDPPATSWVVAVDPRFTATAIPIAASPATAANGLMRVTFMRCSSNLCYRSYAQKTQFGNASNDIYESAKQTVNKHMGQ
jgi:hypothetical protein